MQLSFAQKQGVVWCFGDSALVDFSDTSNIVTGNSGVKSRGSCVSISDSVGNLILYAYTRANTNSVSTIVKNSLDSILQSGDSIVGQGWYRELVILPNPDSVNQYYLFSIYVIGNPFLSGLYFSLIDMNANGGHGSIVQKNIQLLNSDAVDCLTAIRHGNGRDFWILYRNWDSFSSTSNNNWSLFYCLHRELVHLLSRV